MLQLCCHCHCLCYYHQKGPSEVAPCRLRDVMHSWFICWYWHYIHCLLVCLATYFLFSSLIFLAYLLPYLTFPLKMGPLCFQARGCKRRPNLGSFLELCSWCMIILHCSKFSYSRSPRFIIYFCGFCSCFWFCFLHTNQEIGWEEHLGNDLYCVRWDVKP